MFPTRARGAAAIARTYGEEPDHQDSISLQPIPMTVEFSCHTTCLSSFWAMIGEDPPAMD